LPAGNRIFLITALYCSLTKLMPADSKPNLITPDELADLLRISKVGVYRLVEKRLIPFYRVRGSLRFERKDVMAYLAKNRVESAGLT